MAKKSTTSNAVYKMIELVGTSEKSWDDAASNAITAASKTLRDLRVAEVVQMDVKIEKGKLVYRTKMQLSFKYHGND